MIAALSVLAALILLIYILTRNVRITVTKEHEWRVLLSCAFFNVPLKKKIDKSGKKKSPKKKNRQKSDGIVVLAHVLDALTHASLEINRLSLPMIIEKSDIATAALSRWRYSSFICAILALLRARARHLTVGDNAITLNSDGDFFIDISITIRLFRIILTYLEIIHDKKNEKRTGVIAS